MVKSGKNAVHDRFDKGFGSGGKIALDVDPADRRAKFSVHLDKCTTFAAALLRCAVERLAVEFEMSVVDRLGQLSGNRVDTVEDEPVLPALQRLARDQGGNPGDRSRLPGNEVLLLTKTSSGKIGSPIQSSRFLSEIGPRPQVVRFMDVLTGLDVSMNGCNFRLKGDDPVSTYCRISDPGERQQLLDIGAICTPRLEHLPGL